MIFSKTLLKMNGYRMNFNLDAFTHYIIILYFITIFLKNKSTTLIITVF